MTLLHKHRKLRMAHVYNAAVFFILSLCLTPLKSQDTLHVTQNLHIPAEEELHIEAGTVVYFHGYYHISVDGALVAMGTEENPILFTAADTTGLHNTELNEGGWNGIRFAEGENSNSTSNFSHCIFEYSKASAMDFQSGGAISIIGSRDVAISHSTFRHNYCYLKGGAIYLNGNNTPITHSYFFKNTAINDEEQEPSLYADGGAVFLKGSRSEIAWSHFEYNFSSGVGGALMVEEAEPFVYNNMVNHNHADMGGGISIRRVNSTTPFSNNVIVNNSSLYFGGGMFFLDSHAVIANQTIANNYSGYGGGMFFITFNNLTDPLIYNTILRDNTVYSDVENQVFIWDALSTPHFYFSNIQGGIEAFDGGGNIDDISFENNIDEDAMFLSEGDHPYALNPESPSIDAGYPNSADLGIFHLDMAGNERFSGLQIDMGAYEFQNPHFTVFLDVEGEGSVQPEAGQYSFPAGTILELSATPAENWVFSQWNTNVGSFYEELLELQVDEDMHITAVFTFSNHAADSPADAMRVFPNPVTDYLTLHFPGHKDTHALKITITNTRGQVLFSGKMQTPGQAFTVPFCFASVPGGVYMVSVKNDSIQETFTVIR